MNGWGFHSFSLKTQIFGIGLILLGGDPTCFRVTAFSAVERWESILGPNIWARLSPAWDMFGASAEDVELFLNHTLATADIAILDRRRPSLAS